MTATQKNKIKSLREQGNEQGNVLFIILIAVALFAALSFAMMGNNEDTGEKLVRNMQLEGKVGQLTGYMGGISNKVSMMIDINLVLPANVKDLKSGDVGFETSPHVDKIYHPLGGGIVYKSTVGDATNIVFHNSLSIVGIGTAAADLVMVAVVPSLEYCQELNHSLYGVITIPKITVAAYNSMTTPAAVTLDDATTCIATGGCDEVAYQCVTDGTNYVYYHLVYAQ